MKAKVIQRVRFHGQRWQRTGETHLPVEEAIKRVEEGTALAPGCKEFEVPKEWRTPGPKKPKAAAEEAKVEDDINRT